MVRVQLNSLAGRERVSGRCGRRVQVSVTQAATELRSVVYPRRQRGDVKGGSPSNVAVVLQGGKVVVGQRGGKDRKSEHKRSRRAKLDFAL